MGRKEGNGDLLVERVAIDVVDDSTLGRWTFETESTGRHNLGGGSRRRREHSRGC